MIAYWLASHLYPLSLSSCAYSGGYGGMARWQGLIWERLVVNWILEKFFASFFARESLYFILPGSFPPGKGSFSMNLLQAAVAAALLWISLSIFAGSYFTFLVISV